MHTVHFISSKDTTMVKSTSWSRSIGSRANLELKQTSEGDGPEKKKAIKNYNKMAFAIAVYERLGIKKNPNHFPEGFFE